MNMDQRAKYRQAVRGTNEQPQAIKRHASTYNGWIKELTVHILFDTESVCQNVSTTQKKQKTDYLLKTASTNKKRPATSQCR